MDLIEKLRNLSSEVERRLPAAKRSEANTSLFLVMPFFQALGYSVHNPNDVEAEFTADIVSTSNKVDFAIKIEGKPAILVEVKRADIALHRDHTKQLHYYFSSKLDVRFGLLTNGLEYRLYSDLDLPNVMDDDPFLILDLLNTNNSSIDVLERFTKSGFQKPQAVKAARSSKDRRIIRQVLKSEFDPLSLNATNYILNIVQPGESDTSRRSELTRLLNQEWQDFIGSQGASMDSQTGAEPKETSITPNPDSLTFLERTSFLEKYSLDGSVEVPVFADHQGRRFKATLMIDDRMWLQREDNMLFDGKPMNHAVAAFEAVKKVDPLLKKWPAGWIFWHFIDSDTGKERPIKDIFEDVWTRNSSNGY